LDHTSTSFPGSIYTGFTLFIFTLTHTLFCLLKGWSKRG